MTKIAIVHDYLTQMGGAERVALSLSETFPDAPIYTSLYDPSGTFPEFRERHVRPTALQDVIPPSKFRFAAPLYGAAFRRLDLSEFDKVIISSSGFAHHVRHPNAYVYCHTPPHFIYDLPNYLNSRPLRAGLAPLIPLLRRADQRAARRHTNYVANSAKTAGEIVSAYGKERPAVIHPPFNTSHLPSVLSDPPAEPRALIVGRLMPYKRFDVAIAACELLGIPLTIIGTGPDETRLRAIAGSGVTFTGRLDDGAVARAFTGHSVILMPGVEDFGFAPLEANYAGRPVVAFAGGGALETVLDGRTGLLVGSTEADTWAAAIKESIARSWLPQRLRNSTAPFALAGFQDAVHEWVGE